MSAAAVQAETLGTFLRARRGALTPAAAGLLAGGPRRVTGLRREELALLAGVSVDYYVQLEQDRARPSAQVLDAIGTALRLPPDARQYLHDLVVPLPRARPGPDTRTAADVLAAWDDQPALLVTTWLDVVACTPAASTLHGGLRPGDNLARRVFAATAEPAAGPDPGTGSETHQRCMVGTLRSGLRPATADPRATTLVRDLQTVSRRFAALWSAGEVHRKTGRDKRFLGADGDVVTMRQHVLTVADDARLQLWVYRPTPAGTTT